MHPSRYSAEYMNVLAEKMAVQRSCQIYVANELNTLVDDAGLKRWVTNLFPVRCQTCDEPLATKADISADGLLEGDRVLLSMHHSVCRPSGITPPEGAEMTGPTCACIASYLGEPGKPEIPVMVINPSCEQIMVARTSQGRWRNATLDRFTEIGFVPSEGKAPPLANAGIEARFAKKQLTVAVTAELPQTGQSDTWTIRPPKEVHNLLRTEPELGVALMTKRLPPTLGFEELPAAFGDPESLVARVPLMRTRA